MNEKLKELIKTYSLAVLLITFFALVYISPVLINSRPEQLNAKLESTDITSSTLPTVSELPDSNVLVQKCTGDWMYIDSMGVKIDLSYETISGWSYQSRPSILLETINNKNTVLLGHNYCEGGNCNKPTTDFGLIINVKQGDNASACINGNLFQGKVIVSKEIDETATYILDDWLNASTVTAFTCYGECKDASCSAVKSRWVVAFSKY